MKPLTDDEIKEMLAEHYERKHPTGSWCPCDLQNWPCDAHRALTDLQAARRLLQNVEIGVGSLAAHGHVRVSERCCEACQYLDGTLKELRVFLEGRG